MSKRKGRKCPVCGFYWRRSPITPAAPAQGHAQAVAWEWKHPDGTISLHYYDATRGNLNDRPPPVSTRPLIYGDASPPLAAGGEDARDAARYRWLREQHWSESPIACVANPKDALKLGRDCPALERLDAAIDAAMRKEKT